MNDILKSYLSFQLQGELYFEHLRWCYSDATTPNLVVDGESGQLTAGVLILNFAITTTGSGAAIIITDAKNPTEIIYRHPNTTIETIMAPMYYFTKGYQLNFVTTVNCVFGFNYVTIKQRNESKQ